MDIAPHAGKLAIDSVCDGASAAHNEDLVAVFEQDGMTDVLVIDGATSVADIDYADPAQGDVTWFVHEFRRRLAPHLRRDRAQGDSALLALADVRAAYRALAGEREVPAHAWPIAALTWLRFLPAGDGYTLHAWCVGDCKTLLFDGDASIHDLDPYVNPQEAILQAQVAKLAQAGIVDAAARKAALLPMLRDRRVEQNMAPAPTILCLAPQGPIAARTLTVPLARGAAVIAMTDGFWRLVDPYRLLTAGELARRCLADGAASVLAQLRAFEADQGRADSLAVKRADDAAAAVCRVPLRLLS
ncbi:protein phosphatase 2C domain-containing protein [Pseudoduganella armeniaca]|uniref:Protein phosphatase 2C domain-containing protein n=1 Tax=Pseudoduganella armeniaca TaxID=2072590 RepID=A0A2R4CGA1_9BURK|nr:protein phosphatase 2C domain-containing protein [Pseudoduganella armeniaca]AVR98615.1 hypothetical protein C9I28_25520 [Pseudoduganella armeniaca]